MVISQLPNPQLSINTGQPAQLKNAILYANTNTKYYYPAHTTPYLFATNFLNKGRYIINDQPVSISEKCFYFLNPGDELTINFNSNQPLKTLFILFNEDFVDSSIYSISTPANHLLDNPSIKQKGKLNIPNVPFQSGTILSQLHFLVSLNYYSQQEIDDILFNLLTSFAKINSALSVDLQKINSIKRSTREELYKRLFIAKDFMEDNATAPSVSLDDIAAQACMNKFHFLANFKALYGITPHQYIINVKLQKAYQLLNEQHYSVTQVCYSVGFDSLQSFSSLFRRRFKISPSALLRK
ncbi:helix-turn-helix domain-containing protein [Mucilaginibacter sp. OK098]|uniref:helix-turn-helix domain-containing protein n=1 Tax=Mucilaginibacter sp. OK098 TaxID=1855297 RepID=UPI000918188D|nr:helix-turn-helix transcriptional regulator [Mucilaginibacter sp. OK098]SHM24226.1 AraC-type DNA-binding protein [Mucilaginibacter sp. OK098]